MSPGSKAPTTDHLLATNVSDMMGVAVAVRPSVRGSDAQVRSLTCEFCPVAPVPRLSVG
jgi:hypothetical protein